MRIKSLILTVAMALPGLAVLGIEPAHAWKKGLDILTIQKTDKSTYLWAYDRDTGRGYKYHLSQYGIGKDISEEKFNWRKTWTHMDMGGRLRFYHSGTTGHVQLYKMGGLKGTKVKKIKTYSNFRKGFDIVENINYPYAARCLFYDKQKGHAKLYAYNAKNHNFGAPVYKSNKWRKGWDIIKQWHIGTARNGHRNLLLYDRDAGLARIYRIKAFANKIGKRTFESYNWRKTWHSIVMYYTAGRNYALFYDKTRGEGKVYRLDTEKGRPGRLVEHYKGWRKSWDTVLSYHVGDYSGKRFILFYDKHSGDTNVYEIGMGGRLVKRVQAK